MADKRDRNITIFSMYIKGFKLREIGEKFKISKQRVWQIVKPKCKTIHNRKQPTAKANSTPSEFFAIGWFISKGLNVKRMPYNHPYDLEVEGKKIEVKHRSKPRLCVSNKKYYQLKYNFNNLTSLVGVDFYMFICGDLNKIPEVYIYPTNKIKRNKQIPVKAKTLRTDREKEFYFENISQISY